MKHFMVFLIVILLGLFCLRNSHFFSFTIRGERYEYFQTEDSSTLPQILATYLFNSNIRYSVYNIPNYVEDFLIYNKDFSYVYNTSPKCTVMIFKPKDNIDKNEPAFRAFYDRVKSLVNEYPNSFNLTILEDTDTHKFVLREDKIAYKDLKEYCGKFCIINPQEGTMFVFAKISNTEKEALDVLFQQYHFAK